MVRLKLGLVVELDPIVLYIYIHFKNTELPVG